MKAEKWQIIYLTVVIIGLWIGYWVDPLVGVGFIWVATLLAETVS
jgi:hypothetical protein